MRRFHWQARNWNHQTKSKTTNPPIAMTTYISLLTLTDLGARNIKHSPARGASFRESVEAEGIKVLAQYWTAGAYDGVLILQADSEARVLRCLASVAALGNVKTHSLRAFNAEEFAAIVA